MPFPKLRIFGVAACELIHTNGRRILVDPYLDDRPGNPVRSDQLSRAGGERASPPVPDTENWALVLEKKN